MSTPRPGKAPRRRDRAPDPAWAAHGACAGHPDPGLWFTRADDPRYQQAAAICAACPVNDPCLGYAMSVPGLDGTWAGTTKAMRTRLRNQAKHQAA